MKVCISAIVVCILTENYIILFGVILIHSKCGENAGKLIPRHQKQIEELIARQCKTSSLVTATCNTSIKGQEPHMQNQIMHINHQSINQKQESLRPINHVITLLNSYVLESIQQNNIPHHHPTTHCITSIQALVNDSRLRNHGVDNSLFCLQN